MGYNLRVLAEKPGHVPVSQLLSRVQTAGLDVSVRIEVGSEDDWEQLVLQHNEGDEIAAIERNPVEPDALGEAEIEELVAEVEESRPRSAAEWLKLYLPRVKVIYAFQVLYGADQDNGWDALQAIQDELHTTLGGILQADAEGFSNQEGYHILWQFRDDVEGLCKMAVLDETGQWRAFEMDLGSREQREAFLNGRVPEGVPLL